MQPNHPYSLARDKSFQALLASYFWGAFNDNAFKMLVTFVLLEQTLHSPHGSLLLSLSGVVFILPFLVFSTYAGFIADKFSKKKIIIVIKAIEVVLMLLTLFTIGTGQWAYMLLLLFFMGAHSAFLGPAKYGIIPEVVDHQDLSRANGLVQMATYAAIILGQAMGGLLTANHDPFKTGSMMFIAVAVLGLLVSLQIKNVTPAGVKRPFETNPLKEMSVNWSLIRQDRGIFLSIAGLAYFSFLGALFQLNIMVFSKIHLGLDSIGASVLLMLLAVGIGLGSLCAGRVSDQKIELGLVPLGAVGLAMTAIFLGVWSTHLGVVVAVLLCLGFFAGFYTVPINAFIQFYTAPSQRGQLLAANNCFSFTAALVGSVAFYILNGWLHLSPAGIFIVCGVLTLLGAFYAVRILPQALLRLLVWTAAHTFYKIRIIHPERIPSQGGALIVANHVSFIDGVFIAMATERPVRFVMSREMYAWGPIHWMCKINRVIPILNTDKPKEMLKALDTAREAILQGELVCIFPEGQLTRTGNMLRFYRGFEHIMKGIDAPVIPVYLDRIWGSIFSFSGGKLLARWPKILPYPVTIAVGEPMPSASKAFDVRQRIMEIGSTAFDQRMDDHMTLAEAFFVETRRRPLRPCVADSSGKSFNRLMTFTLSLAVARCLKQRLLAEEKVGVLLPPSMGGVLANVAVGILNKVPVNVNYTASQESLASIVEQTGMKCCISAKAFLEKAGISMRCDMIFIEDVLASLSAIDYLKAFLSTAILPRTLAHRSIFGSWKNRDNKSLATIMFTSGSTGQPKGVMLTHANVMSNLEGLYQVFHLTSSDKMLGVLPFFHSFGFTGTVWFPLIGGMGVVYHYNPLDAKGVGHLVEKHHTTILMATPTFLNTYMRRCEPAQFKSLRLVVVGAEKLKEPLAHAFQEKYGFLPMEGYGCTELSPIACVNLPDYRFETIHQRASKIGTIGLPLPGIALRVVNPETLAPMPCGEQGLLLVKGPNVMQGYLNQPQMTQDVIQDGWYKTGDIAKMDEDGFVTITDRLSRFSKIAGEMVPHIKVEEAIHQAMGATEPMCAVASIPDDKKGEQLAVVYVGDMDIPAVLGKLKDMGLPNLWIPDAAMFIKISALPVLGTGKLDLAGVKKMVLEGSKG